MANYEEKEKNEKKDEDGKKIAYLEDRKEDF